MLYGFGTGAAFPLAMTLVLQRSRDVAQTGRLSAASQSLGYLVAATGPLGVGLLHEATGGWRGGLVLLLAVLVGQAAVGLVAARPKLTGGPRRLTRVDHHLFQISREALGADAGAGARPGSDRIAVRNRAA